MQIPCSAELPAAIGSKGDHLLRDLFPMGGRVVLSKWVRDFSMAYPRLYLTMGASIVRDGSGKAMQPQCKPIFARNSRLSSFTAGQLAAQPVQIGYFHVRSLTQKSGTTRELVHSK